MDARGHPRVHESGIPLETSSDAQLARAQPVLVSALIAMSLMTITPLDRTGRGLTNWVLLGITGLLSYSRSLPDSRVPPRLRLGLAVAYAISGGLLFGAASNSWAVAFAYLLAHHVGLRFSSRTAYGVAGLCAGVAAVTLAVIPDRAGTTPWPWYVAGTILLVVSSGAARHNRNLALASANDAVLASRRAVASAAEAGRLAERTRVARDLHDVLAHSLSGVGMKLDLVDALIESGQEERARQAVQEARGLVVVGVDEARQAVQALREDALDVAAALEGMIQPGEEVHLDGAGAGLAGSTALTVVRVVQECLTNARRHAPGAPVDASVTVGPEAVQVVVRNAAASGSHPVVRGSGMGLVGLHERVAEAGGSMSAGPAPDGGWVVEVNIPNAASALGEGASM